MESFEFPGVWWIPTDPEITKFYGPLSFDPKNGGKLSLTFEESGAEHAVFENPADLCIPIVHGKMDGRKVTLIRCHRRYGSGSNRDEAGDAYTQTAIVWTDTVFLGVHFNSLTDIRFAWLSASFTHLDRWMGTEEVVFDEEGNVHRTRRRPVALSSVDDIEIIFQRSIYEDISGGSGPNSEVLVATIIPNERICYDDTSKDGMGDGPTYFTYVNSHLRDFLNLVTGEPNYPFNIFAKSTFEDKQFIRIYYRLQGYDPEASRRIEVSFTFDYEFLEHRFPIVFKNWIAKSKSYRTAIELFFKRYHLSNIDVETQFMFLVQAIEAYHRQQHGDSYLDPIDYSRLKDELSTVIDRQVKASQIQSWAKGDVDSRNVNSLRQKLRNSVKYGNEFSLRRRLKEIREDVLKDNLDTLDKLLENPSVVVHRVTETRNYLAHRLTERNSDVLIDSEYPEYVRKLRKLLRLCFLMELGLPPEDIEVLSQYFPTSAQ